MNSKKILIETNSRPVSALYGARQLGVPHFNKLSLYKFLYQYIYHEKILIPKELMEEIESYNSKQTNEENKLIVGRDY